MDKVGHQTHIVTRVSGTTQQSARKTYVNSNKNKKEKPKQKPRPGCGGVVLGLGGVGIFEFHQMAF